MQNQREGIFLFAPPPTPRTGPLQTVPTPRPEGLDLSRGLLGGGGRGWKQVKLNCALSLSACLSTEILVLCPQLCIRIGVHRMCYD